MVRRAVGTPEEDSASGGVDHVIVVGAQIGLLVSRPGAQAKGVLNQAGAVKATERTATVNVRNATVRNRKGLSDGAVGTRGRCVGRR